MHIMSDTYNYGLSKSACSFMATGNPELLLPHLADSQNYCH